MQDDDVFTRVNFDTPPLNSCEKCGRKPEFVFFKNNNDEKRPFAVALKHGCHFEMPTFFMISAADAYYRMFIVGIMACAWNYSGSIRKMGDTISDTLKRFEVRKKEILDEIVSGKTVIKYAHEHGMDGGTDYAYLDDGNTSWGSDYSFFDYLALLQLLHEHANMKEVIDHLPTDTENEKEN